MQTNNIIDEDYIPRIIEKQKNIALIAHDFKKSELVEWCRKNKEILEKHFLVGTGTTARIISEMTGLPVRGFNSGRIRRICV